MLIRISNSLQQIFTIVRIINIDSRSAMFSVSCGQKLTPADVMGQVMMSLALLSLIGQCRAEANRCAGGVCGSHDNQAMTQNDQPISDAQVRSLRLSFYLGVFSLLRIIS